MEGPAERAVQPILDWGHAVLGGPMKVLHAIDENPVLTKISDLWQEYGPHQTPQNIAPTTQPPVQNQTPSWLPKFLGGR